MITLKTNFGDIGVELDFKKTPKTAENFAAYAKSGFYDGVIFHRVIDNFMIQGGGFTKDMQQKKTNPVIENEADLGEQNKKYTLAMARTSDPHSASAQFFINVADNDFLNFKKKSVEGWGYCVFGKVVSGTEVVDKIKAVPTGRNMGHDDVPVEPVIIESVIVED